MATLGSLPTEILIAIASHLADFQDLAALALTNRRLFSIANPRLYATAARNYKPALFYCAENGLIGPMNSLLTHGADPNQTIRSLISRDSLNRALATQGRRPGKRPLVDRKLAREIVARDLEFPGDGTVNKETLSFYPAECARGREVAQEPAPKYHWTPLHVAAQRGDDALVTLLLDNGAAVDSAHDAGDALTDPIYQLTTRFGRKPHMATPLYFAVSAGHKSTARLLLARGASTVVSSDGITALHFAAWYGNLELCRLLLDENSLQEVDARTDDQLTPLHFATAGGHLQTARVEPRFGVWRGHDAPPSGTDALACALWAQKHSDALMLLDVHVQNAAAVKRKPGWYDPVTTCLKFSTVEQSDNGEELVSLLRGLLLLHSRDFIGSWFREYYILGLSEHLPQFLNLLLEYTEEAPAVQSIEPWVIDAVMALIQYAVSKQGMPVPRLCCVFPPKPIFGDREEMFEARLEIANLVDIDLHDTLICEWLTSLGALRLVDKKDLVIMLNQAACGGDPLLTDWVLTQVENAGEKPSVMNSIYPLGDMIRISGGNEAALVLARRGADLGLALHDDDDDGGDDDNFPQSAEAIGALFSCRTRQRMAIQDYASVHLGNNVLFMACSRPDMAGAVELCRLAIQAAGAGAKRLVSCNFLTEHLGTLSPTSLLCSTYSHQQITEEISDIFYHRDDRPRRTGEGGDEPERLAMLQMVLDAGAAEVHTLAEVVNCGETKDYDEPSELLWDALTREDTRKIERRQAFTPGPIWRVHKVREDPIRCAIRSGFPKLVQAILEARPLPTRNHPAALHSQHRAHHGQLGLCVTWRRPAAEVIVRAHITAFRLRFSASCSPWPTWTMQI
ncbi:hypothetical protein F5144DRAFT_657996 [Chaetomium tenue]|uniref:Uncharacterized protein n=1 Tax=Chaetomium tenue TaxID=1854479 RepID=A0ACB7NYW6_9PEZI|nr:hypothetical protein F5144DRAFT_657996 [Chaetomium globosum]